MTDDEIRQQLLDQEHLRLLTFFYFVSAGVTAFFSLFPALYMAMGLMFVLASPSFQSHGSNGPPAVVGWIFVAFGAGLMVLFLCLAALKFLTARAIRQRQRRTLCLVTAGISCLFIPYGTLLGVLTFIVLERPSVKALFGPRLESEPAPPSSNPAPTYPGAT